jgi:hypothetical protein
LGLGSEDGRFTGEGKGNGLQKGWLDGGMGKPGKNGDFTGKDSGIGYWVVEGETWF